MFPLLCSRMTRSSVTLLCRRGAEKENVKCEIVLAHIAMVSVSGIIFQSCFWQCVSPLIKKRTKQKEKKNPLLFPNLFPPFIFLFLILVYLYVSFSFPPSHTHFLSFLLSTSVFSLSLSLSLINILQSPVGVLLLSCLAFAAVFLSLSLLNLLLISYLCLLQLFKKK